MHGLLFKTNEPVEFCTTGKFDAPTSSYIHLSRALVYSYELIVVTKGILYISYQGRKYSIASGQYVLMHPDETNNHQYGYRASLVDFYWLHFTTSYLPNTVPLEYGKPFHMDHPNHIVIPDQGTLLNPEQVLVLLRHLQDYTRSNYNLSHIDYKTAAMPELPFAKPVVDYLTTTILCEIYKQECTRRTSEEMDTTTATFKKRVYYSILDYIHKNTSINLKAQDIASTFGYNEKYLSRMFKTLTGLTLKQYILQQKVEDANRYLAETEMTISEIAFSLGFTDPHNFMKLYKKVMGLTPTEYRNTFPKRLNW